jgi:tetratricopeptide (TPR) repeat protein
VTALAEDLRRALRHEPISARPDTLRYRARQFVRRHVRGVAMTGAVLLLIGGLTGLYTTRLATERDLRADGSREGGEGERAADKPAERRRPLRGSRHARRADRRGLLDAGVERVQKELAAQPELQAEILTAMGRSTGVSASTTRRSCCSRRRWRSAPVFGPEHKGLAQSLHDLGTVFADKGDYAAAGRSLEQALVMRRTLLGPEHADVAVTLTELSRVYQDQGFNSRAEPLQREALAIRRKVYGDEHRETAVSVSGLASVLRLNGDLAGAESLLRQSLQTNRTVGRDHPNTAAPLNDLGLIAAARGDYRCRRIAVSRGPGREPHVARPDSIRWWRRRSTIFPARSSHRGR